MMSMTGVLGVMMAAHCTQAASVTVAAVPPVRE